MASAAVAPGTEAASAISRVDEARAALKANGLDYDAHVKLVAALREGLPDSAQELRRARREFASKLSLPEDQWLEWVNDERAAVLAASGDSEAVSQLLEVLDLAVEDCVAGGELWMAYTSVAVNVLGAGDDADAVRAVFERAIAAMGCHPTIGPRLFSEYRDFETEEMEDAEGDDEKYAEARERISVLFKRQLALPLPALSTTLAEYQAFLSSTSSAAESDASAKQLPPGETVIADSSSQNWQRRRPFEKTIDDLNASIAKVAASIEEQSVPDATGVMSPPPDLQAELSRLKGELARAWLAYIDVEITVDVTRAIVLFNRAVASCYWHDELWVKFGDAITEYLGDHKESAKVYSRAVKACPSSGTLWAHHVVASERRRKTPSQLTAVASGALNLTFSSIVDYLAILNALAAVHRRAIAAASDPAARAAAVDAGRTAVHGALSMVETKYPSLSDDLVSIRRYWAVVEGETIQDMDQSNALWDQVLSTPSVAPISRIWIQAVQFARAARQYDRSRVLFKRALENVQDSTVAVCDAWDAFEKEVGTLDSADAAMVAMLPFRRRAEEQAAKEAVETAARAAEATAAAARRAAASALKKPKEKPVKKKGKGKEQDAHGSSGEQKSKHSSAAKPKGSAMKKRPRDSSDGGEGTGHDSPTPVTVAAGAGGGTGHGSAGARKTDDNSSGEDGSPRASKRVRFQVPEGEAGPEDKEAGVEEDGPDKRKQDRASLGDPEITVFIRNLAFTATEEDIERVFKGCEGGIKDVRVVRNRRGESRGYAYVDFNSKEGAQAALQIGKIFIKDRPVKVSPYAPPSERAPDGETGSVSGTDPKSVYVCNLPPSVSDQTLRDAFASCGAIKNAIIAKYKRGDSKGYGFVEFEEESSLEPALKLAGELLEGSPMNVLRAKTKPMREVITQATARAKAVTRMIPSNLRRRSQVAIGSATKPSAPQAVSSGGAGTETGPDPGSSAAQADPGVSAAPTQAGQESAPLSFRAPDDKGNHSNDFFRQLLQKRTGGR